MKSQMKIKMLCFFVVATIAIVRADDLTTANGQVYTDVTITRDDNTNLYIRYGPNEQAIFLPWTMFTENQIASIKSSKMYQQFLQAQAQQQKDATETEHVNAIKNSQCYLTGSIIKYLDTGYLASATVMDVVGTTPGGQITSARPSRDLATGQIAKPETVYIIPGDEITSDDKFRMMGVYYIGIVQLGSLHVKAYTTNLDTAIQMSKKINQSGGASD